MDDDAVTAFSITRESLGTKQSTIKTYFLTKHAFYIISINTVYIVGPPVLPVCDPPSPYRENYSTFEKITKRHPSK